MALLKKGGVGGKSTGILRKQPQDSTREMSSTTTDIPPDTSTTPPTDNASPPAPTADISVPDKVDVQSGTHQIEPGEPGEIQALADGSVLQERYLIEGVLGVGGMSIVYRGRDMRFKDVVRHCAIKEMYQRAPDSQTRMLKLKHFERESGLLATLSHPAIPKVYDFFEEHNRVYLVQEMVPGKDLETILEETGAPIDERRVCRWAIQICDVLSYLHHHQPEPIVFRDMKPSNVLVLPDERVVLIDFGIARTLDPDQRKGTMIGTEGYAPPEQYRGTADPQGDIYALGATMHHLLTKNDPRTETPFTFQERPITKLNPAVSQELADAISRALEYDMQNRWSSADEFKHVLIGLSGISDVSAASPITGGSAPAPSSAAFSSATKLLWSFTCEDEVRSSPCVSDGILYVGCYDHNVYAIETAGGTFLWKFATEAGINSSPTVWQDLVIIGSEDGGVYGIDVRNGKKRWLFRTEKPVRSSPRVLDRIVFVGSDDQHFYALDGLRGVVIWKYRAWMPFRSSACIGNGVIYTGCDDGNVYSLDISSSSMKWKQRTQQPVMSTPYLSDGVLYAGSMDSHLYALNGQSGTPIWKYRTEHQIYSSPVVVGSTLYVGSADGSLYALDKKNGRLTWRYETEGQVTSSPFLTNGRVYFGSVDGFVYCINADTGKLVWKYQTDGPVVSSPIVVDDVVYIGSMDQKVYALKA